MRARATWSFGSSVLVALMLAVTPAPAVGQTSSSDVAVTAGGNFETYSFSDDEQVGIESVSLFTIPFGARAVLAPGLQVQLFGNYASGTVTASGGGESTLSGLTDTDIQVDYTIGQDALTLTGVFSLPTGSTTLNEEERTVAGLMAADLLPFAVSNWGTGGGVAFQAAAAGRLGGLGAGVSVGYRLASDFEPVAEDEFTYAPGDELRVQVALDANMGGGSKFSLLAGFQDFSDDAVEGTNVFQAGRRLSGTASIAFPAGYRGAGVFYASVIHREKGTALTTPFVGSPKQDLVLVGGQFRVLWGSTWVRPRVDGRAFRTENGLGQGFLGGVGLSLEIPGGGLTWMPGVTGRFGRVEVVSGRESTFTGLEAGLSVRFDR